MNLNRRIELLEQISPSTVDKLFVITLQDDESSEEAVQRYCQENNLSEADLVTGTVIQIKYV